MLSTANTYLFFGALGSGAAAALHVGCIVFGAPWYRYFGAGSRMIRLAEQGSMVPGLMTAVIALILIFWAYYGMAGAGLVEHPPFIKLVLPAVTVIYLSRALSFPILINAIPGNSMIFWWTSSSIFLVLGLLHLTGTIQVWKTL